MDLTFTGRGLGVTDAVRETAEHKLAAISRLEPRATRIDLEFIAEHHPRVDGTTRVEAAVYVPRKTFRAEAEAVDVPFLVSRRSALSITTRPTATMPPPRRIRGPNRNAPASARRRPAHESPAIATKIRANQRSIASARAVGKGSWPDAVTGRLARGVLPAASAGPRRSAAIRKAP